MESENTNSNFYEKHVEYSVLSSYPPFSTSLKKRDQYREDLTAEDLRIASKVNTEDEDAEERMYSTLEVKWSDDLDEARLYQKRYGKDVREAQKVAIEREGLNPEGLDVPSDV
jgi:hypothetical protein